MNRQTTKSILFIFIILILTVPIQLFSNEAVEKKSIEDLIDRYFSTWSNQEMEEYKSCFHPNAIIHFERNGEIKEDNLLPFIESQKNAHSHSFEKMKEVPISKKIQLDKNIAQVSVRWNLTSTNRDQYGYDFFTLIKYKKKWRIIYLIFNNDP